MSTYTTPVTAAFEAQRATIKQSQQAFEQTIEFQHSLNEAMLDSLDSQESAQRRTVQLTQNLVHGYLDAVEWALGGENHVAEGATVEDTELGSNVLVLPGSEIRDSELDRSVVFRNATITGSDIRNSIIDEETHLDNLDLSGALIGSHSRIVHDE